MPRHPAGHSRLDAKSRRLRASLSARSRPATVLKPTPSLGPQGGARESCGFLLSSVCTSVTMNTYLVRRRPPAPPASQSAHRGALAFESPLQFSSVSHIRLFATPRTAAHQASLTNSRSLFKLMSIESVMPSSHLILCHPLLLLPSLSPSIRVFSDESALCIRWPTNPWLIERCLWGYFSCERCPDLTVLNAFKST